MMSTTGHRRIRALVVDDEPTTREAVCTRLAREGFDVHRALTGEEALVAAVVLDPDVVVIEVELPGLDGNDLCRRLRLFSDCYVVLITEGVDELEVLIGLSAGADDFMSKPVRLPELVARIRTICRRPRTLCALNTGRGRPRLTVGAMSVHPSAREVWLRDALVPLTRTEFDLLVTLADHPALTFTRRALVEAVWGEAGVCEEHAVDVHIGHIRRKLGDPIGSQKFIRTVRGIGYRIGSGT
ncbi:response regulator transcription factor [Actinotalea subterranea]|uniref:response regulator transcription factor n=1 Tax=Actinotalea subterranea TaxID=2607497 RepID=UPI0011ED75C6|nr:response regulator transcription factor [Actinotalea subterranea]